MTRDQRLLTGAVFFAIFWTAFMVWWSANYTVQNIAIMAAIGALVASFWFFAMKRYAFPRQKSAVK